MTRSSGQQVTIVGAGPVGAVLALGLHRRGVPVTILEREPEPLDDQRAAAIQPSSLEMLADLGIIDEIVEHGLISPTFHFRDRVTGDLVAEFDFSILDDTTPYPFVVQYEQFKLVRTILSRIARSPDVTVRYSCRVAGLEQAADGVTAILVNEEDAEERLTSSWLVGCDGFSSVVRQAAGMEFVGFTYPERFVKIGSDFDFLEAGIALCIRNFFSDPEEWCNLFKVNGYGPPGIWRTVFPTQIDETDEECLSPQRLQARLHKFFPRESDYNIIYSGIYHVHQRVVDTFRKNRILVAGDAAHVNNPIGGLGMNGGIHDAVSLSAKLADVIAGQSDDLLDLYSRQRHRAQMDGIQATSIANKKLMEARDPRMRQAQFDEIRKTAETPDLHRVYCLNAGLYTSLERANAIT